VLALVERWVVPYRRPSELADGRRLDWHKLQW